MFKKIFLLSQWNTELNILENFISFIKRHTSNQLQKDKTIQASLKYFFKI